MEASRSGGSGSSSAGLRAAAPWLGWRGDALPLFRASFRAAAAPGRPAAQRLLGTRRWTAVRCALPLWIAALTSALLYHWYELRAGGLGHLLTSSLPLASVPPASARILPLGRHESNHKVNEVLDLTEIVLDKIISGEVDPPLRNPTSLRSRLRTKGQVVSARNRVYSNSYVDLGQAEVLGFDYDYTLVDYRPEVLHLIYDLAKTELVQEMKYPEELLEELPGFDPHFAIRGLAVDLETSWICMITFRRRVSAAFFGRERVDQEQISKTYSNPGGGGILPPEIRKERMRPLNDIFCSAEACLLADIVQWFKNQKIQFDPRSVVTDVLGAIAKAHTSGKMHRAIANNLDHYLNLDGKEKLRSVLVHMKRAGKKLMLVSNSMFWYVDAGMKHVVGADWRSLFDIVVVSAGKPAFYTGNRPFREVSTRTGRIKFKPVTSLEPDEVYCHGSLGELMRLTKWGSEDGSVDGSKVLYLGDSVFADLVEARRLFGWTTGAVIREIRDEMEVQRSPEWRQTAHVLQALFHCMQLCQEVMGLEPQDGAEGEVDWQRPYSPADLGVLDNLERTAAEWRRRQDAVMNPNFGSIFRASKDDGRTAVPSLFARCLQRHVDFYTASVENLRFYSTDHRFYPNSWNIGVLHEASHAMDSVIDLMDEVNQSLHNSGHKTEDVRTLASLRLRRERVHDHDHDHEFV